jgi:hypothetical protein
VEGNLQGTEKLDGQNIYISYSAKDGKAKAVRNKGQIKAGGLDASGLAAAFQGRDTLERAFNEAFASFEEVARDFDQETVLTIFGEDANIFYNSEVMDPRNANVIQYSIPALVVHGSGHVHINKETGEISNVSGSENVEALRNALESHQETVGKQNFNVQINAVRNLQKLETDEAAKEASRALDLELSKYGLKDRHSIGHYLVAKILRAVESEVPALPEENKTTLVKRIVGWDEKKEKKSLTMAHVKKGLSAEEKEYLAKFIPTGKDSTKVMGNLVKQAIGPVELIVHQFAVEALRGMQSAFIVDNEAEVGRLRQILDGAISTIQSEMVKSHYPQALDVLEKQLKKLGAAGIENVSTASEGFVFSIDDRVYKFTGNFAPANQILGMFKYGRGTIAPIDRLLQIVDEMESAKREEIYYMAAVGFKPPHKGHVDMIKSAVAEAKSKGGKVIIYSGRADRDGIGLEESLKVLKIFLNDQGIEYGDSIGQVRVIPADEVNTTGQTYKDNIANRRKGIVGTQVTTKSPMQPLFNGIVELPENSVVFLVSSTDDPGRGAGMRKSLSPVRPDIELFDYAVSITPSAGRAGKLSATDMRKSIFNDDFEAFKEFVPEASMDKAEMVWKILRKENDSQVSESKKKSMDTINHDILSEMISNQLNENKNYLEFLESCDSNEETVEEISTGGGAAGQPGSIEGAAGGVDPDDDLEERKKKKKKKKKRSEQNMLIREIYNYLIDKGIIQETINHAN